MLEMPEISYIYYCFFFLLSFGAIDFHCDIYLCFSRLFGSVAKSCMQKQPQSGGQREEGAPHEMT